jgi:hypothetical protein
MKSKDGFVQAYNAQAAVDAGAQIIVAHELTGMQSDPLAAATALIVDQQTLGVLNMSTVDSFAAKWLCVRLTRKDHSGRTARRPAQLAKIKIVLFFLSFRHLACQKTLFAVSHLRREGGYETAQPRDGGSGLARQAIALDWRNGSAR